MCEVHMPFRKNLITAIASLFRIRLRSARTIRKCTNGSSMAAIHSRGNILERRPARKLTKGVLMAEAKLTERYLWSLNWGSNNEPGGSDLRVFAMVSFQNLSLALSASISLSAQIRAGESQKTGVSLPALISARVPASNSAAESISCSTCHSGKVIIAVRIKVACATANTFIGVVPLNCAHENKAA